MKRWFTLSIVGSLLIAAGPATWELSQYSDWSKGKLKGVSLSREGVLQPGPAIGISLPLGEVSLWSMTSTSDGTVYLGTGPKGRIYRRKPNAKSLELAATLPEPHVFALSASPNGEIFAAGSPGGNVYRITAEGPKLYGQTGAKFLWSLAVNREGVFAGADDGRIFRLSPTVSEVYYETGQSNVTALAFDSKGSLLAGSDPNGILYRIPAKGKAQVLFDAPFTEIRTVTPLSEGQILFLAMGGAAAKRTENLAQPASGAATSGVPQVTTTITVTEEAQAGIDLKPKATPPAQAPQAAPAATAATTMDVPGLDRSAVYRLNTDLTVDSLYVTKEESLYDLAEREGKLYLSSDRMGRIYRLEEDRSATLLLETGESEIGRLVATSTGWLAAVTTSPKLLEVSASAAPPYEYESPVHEASNIALWGALQLNASGELRIETRSGNSAKPDATWSEWQPLKGTNLQSPAARYAQWRMKADRDFKLRSATLNYLPRNQPPILKSVTAVLAMVPSNAPKPQAAVAASSTYTLTITDTGEASSSSAGTASLLATRPAGRQLMLSWVAEDSDSDTLQYSLHFRAEDETEWKLLKNELTETNHSLDADTLADGRYLFRVTASDTLSNSSQTSKSASFTSVPVLLDQTPPKLDAAVREGNLIIECSDAASSIRRIEYSINAGRWIVVDAEDGIFDSREEKARTAIMLPPGEGIVTVRAFDAALNVALKKILVRP
ncbi:MAG: WD40 repeat domain-containing protein [Acidobacteria bacterium]|nr:WD40 repeat domain-containing protein [Acidobacteriota bacterium]